MLIGNLKLDSIPEILELGLDGHVDYYILQKSGSYQIFENFFFPDLKVIYLEIEYKPETKSQQFLSMNLPFNVINWFVNIKTNKIITRKAQNQN